MFFLLIGVFSCHPRSTHFTNDRLYKPTKWFKQPKMEKNRKLDVKVGRVGSNIKLQFYFIKGWWHCLDVFCSVVISRRGASLLIFLQKLFMRGNLRIDKVWFFFSFIWPGRMVTECFGSNCTQIYHFGRLQNIWLNEIFEVCVLSIHTSFSPTANVDDFSLWWGLMLFLMITSAL